MKKLFLLTVVVATFFLSTPSAAYGAVTNIASSFTDVSSSHQYYTAIEYLRTNGMNYGYSNRQFRPSTIVDRAELVTMVVHAHKQNPSSSVYRNCLTDVRTQSYANEICYAYAAGWLNDYGNTFSPDSQASVDDARRIISKAFNVSASVLPTDYGISVDRGEVADLIYRAMRNGGTLTTFGASNYNYNYNYNYNDPYYYNYNYNNTYYASTQPISSSTYIIDPYSVRVPDGYPRPWIP